MAVNAAGLRQRTEAGHRRAEKARRPKLVVDQPKAGPTAYRRAALADDAEQSELLLLHRTVGLLTDAKEAEAWTAIGKLHQMAIDGVRVVRALRAAKSDATANDEAAQRAELESALSEMTADERRELLRLA